MDDTLIDTEEYSHPTEIRMKVLRTRLPTQWQGENCKVHVSFNSLKHSGDCM
jgi:hypothetical protein